MSALLGATLLLSAGSWFLLVEGRHQRLERQLAEAERLLALASTERDDQDRLRSPEERRDLLLRAIAEASATIAGDERSTYAWIVRARAHQRLQQYADAVFDLDTAERLRGETTPDVLQLRIVALRQLGDTASLRRLQQDLTSLLQIDPTPHNRALVAEQLLDYAEHTKGRERAEAIARVDEVLGAAGDEDPGAAVARARRLELDGAVAAAITAMRAACARHEGNLYVHLAAAAMFDRNDLPDEGAREHEHVLRLEANGAPPPPTAPVDVDGIGRFLGEVDRVLHALDRRPDGATADPNKR